MIRLALTLGSIISTVATPVVAQVHHAPTKRALSNVELQQVRERLIQYMLRSTHNQNAQSIRDIVNGMPDQNLENLPPYGNTRDFEFIAGRVMQEYTREALSSQGSQVLSEHDRAVLSLLWGAQDTQLRINSLDRLSQELQRAGRFAEASRIEQVMHEYESGLRDWSYKIAQAQQAGLNIDYDRLRQQFYDHGWNLDNKFLEGAEFGKYFQALQHIENHLNDFNFDGGRIPNLDSIVAASKLAAALHLENMKDYQKIIMWVSGAFSLILSVWIFMLFIRKRKSKVSRSLKTLLVSLSIIMFLVGVAFGVMPFLGGM